MYNLKQFREMTKDLPEDTEIRIESVFKPGQSFHTEVFEMVCNAGRKKIVLLPCYCVHIRRRKRSDGSA